MTRLAFRDGDYLPRADLSVGVGTHALHCGTSVFEGVRAHWDPVSDGLDLFRRRRGVPG
jgi:branched-chain amino acid aminotransferase